MKIVFMGTPDFAVPTLEALYQSRHEVAAVVTQPDKPKGRGKAMAMPPVKEKALEYGIPVYVAVIRAIMMQESGGRGTDPMQSSECPYNTEYPNSPGAIQDADYSIKMGIQYYADCIREHPNSRKYYLF